MAAPSPWRARAKTSKPRLGAIPAPKEASTKIAPRDENPLGPKTVSCGARRKDQRGKDYAVGVHHPLQAGHATTHRLADTPQSDVNSKATLTMVTSSCTTTKPRLIAAKVSGWVRPPVLGHHCFVGGSLSGKVIRSNLLQLFEAPMDGGVVDRILSNPVPGSIFTFLFSQAQPSSIQGLQMCICPDYGQEAKNGLWW